MDTNSDKREADKSSNINEPAFSASDYSDYVPRKKSFSSLHKPKPKKAKVLQFEDILSHKSKKRKVVVQANPKNNSNGTPEQEQHVKDKNQPHVISVPVSFGEAREAEEQQSQNEEQEVVSEPQGSSQAPSSPQLSEEPQIPEEPQILEDPVVVGSPDSSSEEASDESDVPEAQADKHDIHIRVLSVSPAPISNFEDVLRSTSASNEDMLSKYQKVSNEVLSSLPLLSNRLAKIESEFELLQDTVRTRLDSMEASMHSALKQMRESLKEPRDERTNMNADSSPPTGLPISRSKTPIGTDHVLTHGSRPMLGTSVKLDSKAKKLRMSIDMANLSAQQMKQTMEEFSSALPSPSRGKFKGIPLSNNIASFENCAREWFYDHKDKEGRVYSLCAKRRLEAGEKLPGLSVSTLKRKKRIASFLDSLKAMDSFKEFTYIEIAFSLDKYLHKEHKSLYEVSSTRKSFETWKGRLIQAVGEEFKQS